MKSEILYMIGIVAAGFAVNYALRALPFVLFAGRDRALPDWVEEVGKWISPVIIASLVVYSYAGLSWCTPGPLIAGAATVALQLWKRNPLASIVAGTIIYMCFLNLGCTTARLVCIDAENPSIEVRRAGIFVGDQLAKIAEVPEMLEDADVPKTRTVHIHLDSDVKNLTEARTLMGVLAASGYTRPILVTKQHGDSVNKSGVRYEADELVRQGENVFFMVTKDGVRFGLLTPVDPDFVAKCLEDNGVQKDQLIRICGQARDYQSSEVMPIMMQLENVLHNAGYFKVRRCWLNGAKDSGASRQGSSASRPFAVGDRRIIRYKGARE